MKKEIIFFDGDGTLWHPNKTKYAKHPVWLYRDKRFKNHNNHLILTPGVLTTLKKLKKIGIFTIVISTSPFPTKEAEKILNKKIKHFKLEKLFDEIYTTPDHGINKSKGKKITKLLREKKIPKSKALIIGDSYKWDFEPAKK